MNDLLLFAIEGGSNKIQGSMYDVGVRHASLCFPFVISTVELRLKKSPYGFV